MTEREALIEAMAKADQNIRAYGLTWDKLRPGTKKLIMEDMKRHLEAIEAHAGGCAVVPSATITAEMERAMYDQNYTFDQMWSRGCAASPYARPGKVSPP